jgi:FtsZ-binding cell division protein ZapB
MTTDQEIKELKTKEKILSEAANTINVQEKDLPRVVQRFLNEIKEFDEKIKNFKK